MIILTNVSFNFVQFCDNAKSLTTLAKKYLLTLITPYPQPRLRASMVAADSPVCSASQQELELPIL